MKYSVIVPIYNEKENVGPLHADIMHTMNAIGEPYEIIFIDDGSTDGTKEKLQQLSPITLIELRQNFGQTAAMDAGIKHAKGEIVITLDGDGQNPPSEIPKLLQKMKGEQLDVVSGWRKNRKDSFFKRFVSRGALALRSIFVKDNIHDSGCSLKVYKRECFEGVDLFGEMHRFIPAILGWSGFTIGEVEVEHKPRIHGHTKYTWKRVFKGFIDMIAILFWRKYAGRPLHLFGGLGLLLVSAGMLLALYLAVMKIVFYVPLASSNLPLLAVLAVILGVQFFVSGILADIAIRNYYKSDRMPYSIRKITTKQ